MFGKKKQAPKKYFYFVAYVVKSIFGNTIVESKVPITDLDTIRYLEGQIAIARQKEGKNLEKDLETVSIVSFTPL